MPMMIETPTKWTSNNIELAPNCPRCASSNTKFCYYNNYSLSQPRYFCKACKRYWTKGGSLRNVPVGGGCRKSRRARASRGAPAPAPALSPGNGAGSAYESENGSEIDLAAVFAKYVNHNVDKEEFSSPGDSSVSSDNVQTSSLDIDGQMDDNGTMFEYRRKTENLIDGGDDDQMLHQMLMDDDFNGHNFMYQNSHDALEVQGILGADVWSDGINLQSFEGQDSMVQMQDLGLFSPDHDHFRVSANLVQDSWGSFDLSAYEFLSKP
ncbi:hypothetical protein ACJIZ3_024675 [Penstemon smallii]|uniref:Dof zinc finger protein n=1 Tax=Penstemon smallii TaxID=265156 RepID=A0ABD3TSI8_9LAMI